MGRTKLTYKFVKNSFEKEGFTLLSTEYKTAKTELNFMCIEGHKHKTTWDKWKQGIRCPYCSGKAKKSIQKINNSFEKENYTLLSTKYINCDSKLSYICSKGHIHNISWSNWNKGQRCSYCVGLGKPTIDFVRKEFEKDDYILLSTDYINAHTKLKYVCSNGHDGNIVWNNWKYGQRCPKCKDHGTSNFEKEVKQFIINQEQEIIENDRTTIIGNKGKFLELDILFPCKTKAIECNGKHWHNRPEVQERDKIKIKQCKNLNIDLLIIDYDEWTTDKEKQKLSIKEFINNG